MKYVAKVSVLKHVEKDNYEKGCHGGGWYTFDDTIHIEFDDQKGFIDKIAEYASSSFDISESDFKQYVNNECDIQRFDYAQPEDAEANKTSITKENPDGYYAYYTFYILEVTSPVQFNWEVKTS